jgi:hypothetical protein
VTIPAILDIEASGLGRGSYPVEIGYVLGDGGGDCMIIRPEPDWTRWDSAAQQLHGLTREQLLRSGLPVREVAERLNRRLAGQVLYSDAWGNDLSWLGLLFDRAGLVPRFRLESLRRLLDDRQLPIWHATQALVTRELNLTRHRASGDARILQQTFLRTRSLAVDAEEAPAAPLSC